ncbi:enoyl-CoA hydratase/isomerase family protein [Schlesneria paludicola]|uniref:enoyl-CoA hydratase/isomerase family protein n=1 Tax=Schlesneria paludicola TaxID=360056 RepID=UPI00029A7E23|nr:enoyl-CoA hydratase/isomerase family protein [Schlesneria paludicola]
MDDELIQLERDPTGVVILTLNRGDKRNALNVSLLRQLADAIEDLERDHVSRVVIIRGNGPVFCAGLDLIEANDPAVAEHSAAGINRMLAVIQNSPLIVIAAAHGGAYAGGAGMLAACDLVVGADDLKLGFPEVRRGLVAAMVWGVLTRKVRDGDLRELLLLGEPITADRARQMGLVQWIVPPSELLSRAREIAVGVVTGGPHAVRETKLLLNQDSSSVNFVELQALHERVRMSDEAREGLAAFRERREPHWRSQH